MIYVNEYIYTCLVTDIKSCGISEAFTTQKAAIAAGDKFIDDGPHLGDSVPTAYFTHALEIQE